MLSVKAAMAMKNKYPHYVPFFREFYEAAEAQRNGTGNPILQEEACNAAV